LVQDALLLWIVFLIVVLRVVIFVLLFVGLFEEKPLLKSVLLHLGEACVEKVLLAVDGWRHSIQ